MRQQSSGEGHWYRDPEERKGLHYYCLSFCGPVDEGMLGVRLGQTSTKVKKGRGNMFYGFGGLQLSQAARTSLLSLHSSTPTW